jgi:hypothetical protein
MCTFQLYAAPAEQARRGSRPAEPEQRLVAELTPRGAIGYVL